MSNIGGTITNNNKTAPIMLDKSQTPFPSYIFKRRKIQNKQFPNKNRTIATTPMTKTNIHKSVLHPSTLSKRHTSNVLF